MLTKDQSIKCDICGKFIAIDELITQKATHVLLTPDSELTKEEYESYHHKCLRRGRMSAREIGAAGRPLNTRQ